MNKVEPNKYKELKKQRSELFNIFKQAMDIEYLRNNLNDNISSIAVEYGVIAEYIFNYYTNPQIQSEVGDRAVEKIKELSAKIELLHPKKDRETFAKNNKMFIESLLIIDAINAGTKNIDKQTIENTKKEFLTNPLLQKYAPGKIEEFIKLLDNYAKTAPISVKEEDKPIYQIKETMKKNDQIAKVLIDMESNSIVLRALAATQNQR